MKKYDLSSFRVLGTVGEPINPEAWRFYFDEVGKKRCVVVDTFWQTETGGHMITNLPGCQPMKPGAASLPHVRRAAGGRRPADGAPIEGNDVEGVLCVGQPWPGIARSIWGDHGATSTPTSSRTPTTSPATAAAATRTATSGSPAASTTCSTCRATASAPPRSSRRSSPTACVEAAVIGIPHDIKGQGSSRTSSSRRASTSRRSSSPRSSSRCATQIGGLAIPEFIVCTPGLPKTRSGKIMRRVLRKVACRESDQLGDVSTLADPSIVALLIEKVNKVLDAGKQWARRHCVVGGERCGVGSGVMLRKSLLRDPPAGVHASMRRQRLARTCGSSRPRSGDRGVAVGRQARPSSRRRGGARRVAELPPRTSVSRAPWACACSAAATPAVAPAEVAAVQLRRGRGRGP